MPTEISVLATANNDGPGPTLGSDVTFLPRAEDDGVGVYAADVPTLIDELESAGVTAVTWHAADRVEFLDERGPIGEIVLNFAVGVASSGGWSALQSLLRRRRAAKVKLSVVVENGSERRRVEASGDGEGVAAALAQLDLFGPDQP